MSNTGGRSSSLKKKESGKLVDKFKGACPPHKLKDLETLVRQLKGDEEKIQQTIAEWWEEPETVEPEWEDVNKKSSKKNNTKPYHAASKGGRGGRGGGRFSRSGMSGGRGGGAERRSRDFADKRVNSPTNGAAAATEKKEPNMPGPAPVKTVPPLQGAWGQRAVAPPPAPANTTEKQEPIVPEKLTPVGVVTDQDPTPAGVLDSQPVEPIVVPPPKPVTATGNVWATKGSAHLIEAEKPKPVVRQPAQDVTAKANRTKKQPAPKPEPVEAEEPVVPEPETPPEQDFVETTIEPLVAADALENGLPASVNGANVNAAGWKPISDAASTTPHIEPSPVGPVSVASVPSVPDVPLSLPEPTVEVVEEVAPIVPVVVEPAAPAKVLNMGHWETGENDESQDLDFGFGSFGADNDTTENAEETITSSITTEPAAPPQHTPAAPPTTVTSVAAVEASTQAATVSPARPPPGLGIGMPPMPANVVHVHELENKLERASLADKKEESTEKPVESALSEKKTITTNLSSAPTSNPPADSVPSFQQTAAGVVPNTYATAYGMGIYNYNQSASGFMGVHAPVLGANVLPHQQKQQQNISAQQQQASAQNAGHQALPQQQGGIYGAPSATNSGSDNVNTSDSNASTPALPPGMHGGMPYNPALFYSQQHYQMGQHHGGVGYGYGYGAQFGGVQGGFGYQQVMGQGGYGQHYDEQAQHHGNISSHHSGNSHQGGYNKNNGGGYRGRNSHHNNHHGQYQNQYNPQGHAGYGAQPYSMGYSIDHYNQQRGGYGPGNMDPYGMQNSGYQSGMGGFSNQDEDQQHGKGKGKNSNNRGFGSNPNVQQYQQPPQQQAGQSQDQFGLSDVSHAQGGTTGGWSNPNWGGPSWQGS